MKIDIENLTFSYGKKILFDKANMSINGPGIYPIIGANGVGKTSLCLLLMGLLAPYKGRIVVNNQIPQNLSALERAKIFSYLPQQEEINAHVKVRELLKMSLFYRDHVYWRAEFDCFEEKLLEDFNLVSFLDSPFGHLSGGEKRKVLLASMFLRGRSIAVLDEPFSFLDPGQKREVIGLIEKNKNRIIVAISHEMSFIKRHFNNALYVKNKTIQKIKNSCNNFVEEVYG